MKIRCITLNYRASKMANFEVIKAMILRQGESVVKVHTKHKFKRKRSVGVVDLVMEPEKSSIEYPSSRDGECLTICRYLSAVYIGRYRGLRALLQTSPLWAMIKVQASIRLLPERV